MRWWGFSKHSHLHETGTCVDVSTIWRLLKVSNFTRWKMVTVWSDLLGARYLNVFYMAIMRCWCLLMTQEQIQGIGQEGSLRKSLQFPRNSSYMPNSPKILTEKCIYYAVHVFLIMVVVTDELHHKINLVKHTDCNESEWEAFYNSSTKFVPCLWEYHKYHKHHKHCRQDGTTNSSWHTSCMSNNYLHVNWESLTATLLLALTRGAH